MNELTITEDPKPQTPLARVLLCVETKQPIPALTVDEIDQCLAEFQEREVHAAAGEQRVEEAKAAVIAVVKAHGTVPPDAAQSKRILGRRNVATVTTGNTTTINEPAIDELGQYCGEKKLDDLFDNLFATEISHKLIHGARNVLGSIKLPKSTHEKILSLFGRCFDVKPKSPTLKVDVIKPEKPARKTREKAGA